MDWHWYFSAFALAGGACLAVYAFYAWQHRRASAGASLAIVLAAAGEVVPRFVELEVAVPHLSPAVW